jgi:cytochrome P450
MPAGWSWVLGHTPPLANVGLVTQEMLLSFSNSEMFLLDLWPSYPTVIVSSNPETTFLVSQKYNLPKPRVTAEGIKPIVGGLTILSMNGSEWKTWRSRFNHGFSATSLMEQVPYIVDRVQVLCDKLSNNAGKGIISLDDFASRLTFEVIMKVSLLVQPLPSLIYPPLFQLFQVQ